MVISRVMMGWMEREGKLGGGGERCQWTSVNGIARDPGGGQVEEAREAVL